MHSLNNLAEYLGWSYQQTRRRVLQLDTYFSDEVNGGDGAKYLVTDNGLKILEQVKELESSGLTTKDALKQVKDETDTGEQKLDSKDRDEVINQLKERINHLESEIKFKNERIERLESQFLPKQNKSLLQRIKEFIG